MGDNAAHQRQMQSEQRRRRRQRARQHRHQSHRLRSTHSNEVVVEIVHLAEYAAAGVECQKPNHDETTIKLTSIKLGNYGSQRWCFSQPGAYCASSPREKQNQQKPVQNDPKKKESHFKKIQKRKKEKNQNEIQTRQKKKQKIVENKIQIGDARKKRTTDRKSLTNNRYLSTSLRKG
jgi:hypothetical protein